ncbi:MAG: LysE family translocator [Parachlamydiales bacterium]|jgi:RhtB (resistance to homoserine/threonine) family protein
MEDLTSILTVGIISLVAAISPGPDFFIVLKNSLTHSRKAGFLTAFGVSLAVLIHLTYTLVGIGVLIIESPILYGVIKYVGVAYLFYIGLKSIISSFGHATMNLEMAKSKKKITTFGAISQGFLTNLLNPKAAIFFISLFSQFIDPNTPTYLRVEFAIINWAACIGWFLCLSYIVTINGFTERLQRFQNPIDRIMGGALLLLGVKLLFV